MGGTFFIEKSFIPKKKRTGSTRRRTRTISRPTSRSNPMSKFSNEKTLPQYEEENW